MYLLCLLYLLYGLSVSVSVHNTVYWVACTITELSSFFFMLLVYLCKIPLFDYLNGRPRDLDTCRYNSHTGSGEIVNSESAIVIIGTSGRVVVRK